MKMKLTIDQQIKLRLIVLETITEANKKIPKNPELKDLANWTRKIQINIAERSFRLGQEYTKPNLDKKKKKR